MNGREKQMRLDMYADGFDVYMDGGRMAAPVDDDDGLLGRYVRDVIDRNPNLGGSDIGWREVFKENLQDFLGGMLDKFREIDRADEIMKMIQSRFIEGTTSERREMWQDVKTLVSSRYSTMELDVEGYDSQLTPDNESAVFDSFARQWASAEAMRMRRVRNDMLSSSASQWERSCMKYCEADYLVRRRVAESSARYPQLADIAGIIGRSRRIRTDDVSKTMTRYVSCAVHDISLATEIDRVTAGRDPERVIPSELIYLADEDTDMMFFVKYGMRQLQQFASPGSDTYVKLADSREPRATEGPIIVSVDTSSSMDGEPLKAAFAMLHRLVDIASKEHRRCYLITFAVECKAIDLGMPGNRRAIDSFLEESFSGGTNGERMLREAVDILRDENYVMADVLIISDFAFAPPTAETLAAMRSHQAADTRFYGLQIGAMETPYRYVLDRIWVV